MTTQSRGPWAGFGWLQRGISVGYRHPKPIFGGAAFLLLIALVPSLVTLPLQFHSLQAGTPLSPTAFIAIMAASMLVGLLVVPLYAGYLQVIDASERGLPARASDIFNPYRHGGALRLIGYGLAILLIYVALVGIVILAAGRGLVGWYTQALAAQTNHQPPPGLPQGFAIAMALFTVMGLFMLGLYSVSLGQVALRGRGVLDAIGDGFLGALKNLLPLLVLAVSVVIAWIAVAIAFAIVMVVFVVLGMLIGKWLMVVLFIPAYLILLLAVLAAMFGVMYFLWRDVCGDDTTSGMASTITA